MNDKVSIIIPVYNCEKYLKKCILSILTQTYSNLEIILVDDGSTDKSGEICDYYAKIDERILTFHKLNSGVSSTRNFGLDKSTGEFICFVDADDWIDKNMINDSVKILNKTNVDILKYSYKKECKLISKNNNYNLPMNCIIKKCDYVSKLYEKSLNSYDLSNVWGILFKKSIIANIRFDENIKYGEDTLFFYRALSNSNDIFISSHYYYHYRLVNNSVIRQFSFDKIIESIKDNIYVIEYISNDLMNKYNGYKLVDIYKDNKLTKMKKEITLLLLVYDSKNIEDDCNRIMQLFGNDFFDNIDFDLNRIKTQKIIKRIKKILYY